MMKPILHYIPHSIAQIPLLSNLLGLPRLSPLERMEQLAQTNLGTARRTTSIENSLTLKEYQAALGINLVRACDWTAPLKGKNDHPKLMADIGGVTGAAIAQLATEKAGWQAFCIDPEPHIPDGSMFGEGILPSNRYIRAHPNDLSQIPEESFHLVVSYGVLGATQIERSLIEVHRVLAVGGMAIVNIDSWATTHLDALQGLPDEVLNGTVLFRKTDKRESDLRPMIEEVMDMPEIERLQFENDWTFIIQKL